MDWHEAIGILAAILQIGAVIPYVRAMLRGSVRPNLVSWSLWTLSVLISLFAQVSAGPSWSLLILITATLANLTVIFLGAIGYSYRRFGIPEGACLLLSLAAMLLWQITSNPLIALGFAIAADAIAYIPTLIKTYRDPASEMAFWWFMLALVGTLSAISTTKIDFANLAFPVYYGLVNLALAALIIWRKNVLDVRAARG